MIYVETAPDRLDLDRPGCFTVTMDPFKTGLAAARRGDFAAALAAWRPLAEQGDRRAQYNLGFLFANGQGVQRDYPEALRWYEKAAVQGFAPAQFNLGVLYASGEAGVKDLSAALRWYRQAAAQGDADAQYNLGVLYATGQGVPQDLVRACLWYERAAAAGSTAAARTRDSLALELSPAQLAEVRTLLRAGSTADAD